MENINVNGIQLAYTRKGTGKPLVLVHGYPLDHTTWNEVLPLLEDGFDIILPDLRGFGNSDVVESQYKISDMAADVAGLLDQLEIQKTSIAGHSMGGYIALAFARAYPERVAGLGLIASQALADSGEKKAGRYNAAVEIMKSGVKPVAESFPASLTSDEGVQVKVHKVIAGQRPAGLAGALKAMAERDDLSPILSKFDFPVVIVHGSSDGLIPVQRAREVKAEISHAILTELPDVGHMPMMEDPQSTASALRELL